MLPDGQAGIVAQHERLHRIGVIDRRPQAGRGFETGAASRAASCSTVDAVE
jgi:hypothetical protein